MSAGWDGAAYDRVSAPQTRWGALVLDRLDLRGDETVLDIGCGSGRVTELLTDRVPHGRVLAFDRSPSMLDEARRRLGGIARVRFIEGDALTLSPALLGADAPVDAVFSTATFHHIPDHPRLFAAIASVLRTGGRLVAQCGGEGNLARFLEAARRCGIDSIGAQEYASASTTAARLNQAGFTHVRVWTADEPTTFDDTAQLTDFLEAVCLRGPIALLEPHERRALVANVAAAMDPPVLDYVRLNIDARMS